MVSQMNHSDFFKRCRNESLNKISDPTNNLIIRLDKLINDFRLEESEAGSRKEFEQRVVPWLNNSEFQECNICKLRFSLTKRKHHCRLCGTVICGNSCSQFLSFSSAKKLTGLEFSADILTALSREDDTGSLFGAETVVDKSRRISVSSVNSALPLMLNNSFISVKSRLGSLITSGVPPSMGGGAATAGEEDEPRLRICRQCKALLERRERMMELRMANSVFVDVYQKLSSLLTHIGNLAPSYRNMTESLNNGEAMYSLETANELRKKMIGVQREIASLSERIEHWGLLENDPLVTHKPTDRELLLQRNIKMLAITTLHEAVMGMPDLPTAEQYEELKEQYRERIQRQLEQEQQERALIKRQISQQAGGESAQNGGTVAKVASSTPVLISTGISSLIREFRPSSSNSTTVGQQNRQRSDSSSDLAGTNGRQKTRNALKMRPSSSFTGGMDGGDSGWAPEDSFQQQHRLNPFLEDEFQEMHPVQQQFMITRSYLEQAANAGRLDEVEMLEKNLRELELDLKRSGLETPGRH